MRTLSLREATVRSVNVVQMIEVTFPRGAGVEDDPVRLVTQYWTMDGKLLLEKDNSLFYRPEAIGSTESTSEAAAD